jgi:hypothetical protein
MSYVMVDIESDGPIPGDYSMICFGAIIVEPSLSKIFYGQLRPISERWIPESLAICGFTREETLEFREAATVMLRFQTWLSQHCGDSPIFISDNTGFDWQFINWYFHHFMGSNPFGFSAAHLGSLYKGIVRDTSRSFRHLRRTRHTHHPVDDAMGNAQALLALRDSYQLKIHL